MNAYEAQIEEYLSGITLPPDCQQRIIEAYIREDDQVSSFEQTRQPLTTRLARLKEMYEWGDISPQDYREKRDLLKSEPAALPPDLNNRKATLEHLALYLADIGAS